MTQDLSRPKHRYVALDSLRGICACLVILYHFPAEGFIGASPFFTHGWLFVDFFFVLSGFVIASSYGPRLAGSYSITDYMIARFFRIYPLHLVMLIPFLAFEVSFLVLGSGTASRPPFEGAYTVESFVYTVLLVQIFFGAELALWNGPSWSIAAEFWTYLLFAVAMKLGSRFIVALCLLAVLAAPVYLSFVTDRNMSVFHQGALARCIFGFAMGVLCWKLPERVREWPLPRWLDNTLEAAVVALCTAFVTVAGAGRLSLAAPLVFVLAVAIFSRQRGAIGWLLQRGPFVAVGTLSYAIYMTHAFLLMRFMNVVNVVGRKTGLNLTVSEDGHVSLVNDPVVQIVAAVALLGGVIIVANLVHRFVEAPGMKLGKALTARRHAAAATPAVQPS